MQLSSDADVGQKGGCFVRACLQGFVLSIGSLPKKRGRRARRKTTRLFCTRAVLQPTCVADFSRTQTTTFTFLNVRRRPVQQSPPHSIKRSGQAFSCAQPFFGVLRVCVCSMEGLLQGRKDGALFGQRFFLSVCSRRISIGRARLVFAAGLEAGPGRPVCLCACLVLETVFGIECVRVCVCVFHARFA